MTANLALILGECDCGHIRDEHDGGIASCGMCPCQEFVRAADEVCRCDALVAPHIFDESLTRGQWRKDAEGRRYYRGPRPTAGRVYTLTMPAAPKTCVECGQPARGYSEYCPDCHFDAFGGGADIG